MTNKPVSWLTLFLTLLTLLLLTTAAAQARATSAVSLQQTADAEIVNDEGGPITISGITDYKNSEIVITGQEPVVALVDMSAQTQRDYSQFAPITGQILGYLTTDLAPPPVEYTVPLPIAPQATPVDLDNDGEEDTGVQIFRLALVSNINGGSYLEQLDQWGYLNSYLVDNEGEIEEGSFLLYAADDQQGFPANVGEDGLLFTEDDAIVTLPQGYTVAYLNADGDVTFDRAQQGRMDILEPAAVAYPDFTDEGILESYNSLIDVLIDEYAFTELRQLDWEEIRATYLPRVEEAEANQDVALYSAALKDLAQSIRDAHVQATGPGVAIQEAPIAANLGANVVELADGRFVVTEIAPGSPLDEAGVVFGTEIISVNGETVEERLPSVLYSDSTGTEEGQRLRRVRNLLRFPQDAEVELVYRLPESDEELSATLTAGSYPLGDPLRVPLGTEIIHYDVIDANFGYVTWLNFEDPLPTVIPYADFLKRLNERDPILTRALPDQGLILDMRSNGGGWDAQYLTMASYLFSEEEPLTYHWMDEVRYDDETGEWIPEFKNDWLLSAPDPEAYYGGEVIVLVDPSCASSCEFFTALLQSTGRATVMGYYATNGAGGPIKRAALPGGFLFQYPWQGAVFPGTDTQVLEGIGVEPDIRVPVTLESEQARLNGEDPLLQAAVTTLGERAGERYAASITLVPVTDPEIGFTAVVPEDWAPIGQGIYVASDGATNIRISVATPPIEDIAAALRPVGVVDMDSALLEEYTANGLTWSIYGTATSNGGVPFYRQIAIASDEDATYSLILASLPFMADALRDSVIKPTIDTFEPETDSQTPSESSGSESEDSAVGLGDTYFPLEGNPGYDVQHYTIDITVDPNDILQISGVTTIEALATNELPNFNLDFLGLEISDITVDGVAATFARDGQELTVIPATPISDGTKFAVVVTYAGNPQPYADPALYFMRPPLLAFELNTGWIEWADGYIGAVSQPDGGMAWFPSNNHPSDKATYTYRITVDAPKMALATGILQEVIAVDENTNTYIWEMDDPMATQVTGVMIGEFDLVESQSPDGMPIRNYFTPDLDPTIIASYDRIGEMLDFLATLYGEYPYEAYGVVTMPGWPSNSGLETQSLTTMGADPTDEFIMVHELAHQWFGNTITVREWGDLWLHEGFARYSEALWMEESQGIDAYNDLIVEQYENQINYPLYMAQTFGTETVGEGQVIPPVDQPIEWLYFTSYTGGALALHTLRMEVGDEIFFEILPTFYQRFKDVPVTTEDFIATAEEVSGLDLGEWADIWLFSNEVPADFPLLSE